MDGVDIIMTDKCETCPVKSKCSKKNPDLKKENEEWFYSDIVKDHFFKPRNLLLEEPKEFGGVGDVGSPACGDTMRLWIWIDKKTQRIEKCKWKTFGCASAIASTSMLSVMVTENGGMKIKDAKKITAKDILKRLGGLPAIKIHCSVLGDQALRAAIKDYESKKK
jgi:NifU-like protein involved in Fe-S cluster formation